MITRYNPWIWWEKIIIGKYKIKVRAYLIEKCQTIWNWVSFPMVGMSLHPSSIAYELDSFNICICHFVGLGNWHFRFALSGFCVYDLAKLLDGIRVRLVISVGIVSIVSAATLRWLFTGKVVIWNQRFLRERKFKACSATVSSFSIIGKRSAGVVREKTKVNGSTLISTVRPNVVVVFWRCLVPECIRAVGSIVPRTIFLLKKIGCRSSVHILYNILAGR